MKSLQKAIVEKRIRKTSQYAKDIEYIQNFLVRFHNDMRSGTKTVVIPTAKYAELKKTGNVKWADHVALIREFINILNATKKGTKEKATALLSKLETRNSKKTPVLEKVQKSLKDYLAGKTDSPEMTAYDLEGLYGLAGLGDVPPVPSVPAKVDVPLPSSDFKNASFKLMGFAGKWLQLVGNPSEPFKAMVWGTGGSGKSTLALEFALMLAKDKNKRVLYVANEEGAGATPMHMAAFSVNH